MGLHRIFGTNGYVDSLSSIAVDSNNDVIVGGYMGYDLKDVNNITNFSYGGNTDFFIAKFANQACASLSAETFENAKVEVFPNPTTDSVKINFEATEQAPVTIQIADGLGRVLFSQEHPTGTGTFVFDATKYAAGYYPIQIRQKGIVIYNNKIIKK
jgi:hypothetical protein